jgi:hypothetical protein
MNFNKKIKMFIRFFLEWLESYFLGKMIEERNICPKHIIIIDKSDLDIKYIQSELKQLCNQEIKSPVLVFIGPCEEPMLVNLFGHYSWLGVICLYPTSINQVGEMLDVLGHYLDDALLVIYSLSQLPDITQEKNNKYLTIFYTVINQLYMVSKKKSWPVFLMDDEDNLGEKNSAIIRRLFNQEHGII